ncbi:T9SS type A sorting domain-containing protein [Flavobacterium notoginsengisoli]|uniref:T9SS type A sorting domain-containing protein n=1 Tax=Flavobacterium notoginsengisoli TaxID=1478199 RepID=UPI0036255D6D
MKKTLLFLIYFLSTYTISAQNPTDVDINFGPHPGFNGNIYSTAVQSDGKILVGGAYNSYQGSTENYLTRLNPDGSKDSSFKIDTGFDSGLRTIVLQKDGKILVGGAFTNYQSKSQNCLIRLNADGSKDTSFDIGSGFDAKNSVIYSIAIQKDGKIIIGGNFSKYKNKDQKNLIRLNSDGSKDDSFDIGTGPDNTVKTIAIQNDDKIVIGGNFTKYNNLVQYRLTRLNQDGSKDTTIKMLGSGFDDVVNSIAITEDGKILVGGQFYKYSAKIEKGFICLNSDGTKDTTFAIGQGFGSYTFVNSIIIQNDGKIIVGGQFEYYQNLYKKDIVRLNKDGSIDNSFKIEKGINYGSNGSSVYCLTLQNDGKVIVAGDFSTYQETVENRLVRLNPDASKDVSFNIGNGFSNTVLVTCLQSDGKILVGGQFLKFNGSSHKCLVRLNSDGSKDYSFNVGSGFSNYSGGFPLVQAIAQQADGKIIIGGCFTDYQGYWQKALIRLNTDGSIDKSFDTDTDNGFVGANGAYKIQSIVIQPDGKIIVGSDFTQYRGVNMGKLIRLNADGSIDKSFAVGRGFDKSVRVVKLLSDGKILVGGEFTTYQGVSQKGIIRLKSDASKDTSFDIGKGFGSTYTLNDVLTIEEQKDGKIIVGGTFKFYQDINQNYITRLNSDGSLDSSFNSKGGFNFYVNSIALQNDGKIIVGGDFSVYQNYFTDRLARLNSDGSLDSSFNGTEFGLLYNLISDNDKVGVRSVTLQNNGKILVSGSYSSYKKDNFSAFLIRLKGTEVVLSNEDFIKENKSFSVWPNPVKNTLNINSLQDSNYSIKIYDLLGRLIYTKENVNTSIDVSSFTSGLYLIKIKAGSGETSQKFIKI